MKFAIVIKYSDRHVTKGVNTVEAHNKVLQKNNEVWFGKLGLPLDLNILSLAASPNIEMLLILVRIKTTENQREIYNADVSSAQNKIPPLHLVPSYYRDYRKHYDIHTWFCLSSLIKPMTLEEAESWCSTSSGLPLLRALRQSGKSYFYATEKDRLKDAQTLVNSSVRRERNPILSDTWRQKRPQFSGWA